MSEEITKEEPQVEEAPVDTAEEKPGVKKGKKKFAVIGIVAAVVIVAGAGFYAWHEQPSFCSSICHYSMDAYLPTYESQLGSEGVDKWGNTVADSSAMLAPVHREQGITCLGCHTPVISEQLTEGMEWVSGNYTVVSTTDGKFALEERDLSDLTEASGVANEEFCLKSGCHVNDDGSVMTRDDLVEKTSNYSRNPHVQQHGEVACSECHKAHRASTVYCGKCHSDVEYPSGWVTYAESQNLAEN